jgi:hypothetical protein
MKKTMKTIEQFLASKEIAKEAFDTMAAGEISKIYKELNEENVEAFKALQENGATAKDLSDAVNAMNKENADKIEKVLLAMEKGSEASKAQGLAIAKLMKGGSSNEGATIKSILKENKEEIKNLALKITAGEIAIKADTVLPSIGSNDAAFVVPGIGQLGHKKLTASNIFPVIPVTGDNINSDVKYYDWDEATTVRAAATIAEGGTFPESTAKFMQYNLPIRKIGDTLPVSEEFFEDESMFAAELQMFLITNVDVLIDDQIINGLGTGTSLTGLVTSSPAYTPVASGITDASIYDLLVKVSEDITTNRGSKYVPNFALMNIADINQMKLKKDGNNNYVMPPFVSRDGENVSGMVIVEDNNVVANTMIVGDTRYGKMYQRAGLTVARGEINSQFVEDMMTLKVRKRLAFLVKTVDQTGFRKVTSISAALTTLAT